MENFKTEVNIAPGAKVQFELHYQEVKWRKLGSYEHRLHLQPGRLAKHLEVSPSSYGSVPHLCFLPVPTPCGVPCHSALPVRVACRKDSGFRVKQATSLRISVPAHLLISCVSFLWPAVTNDHTLGG